MGDTLNPEPTGADPKMDELVNRVAEKVAATLQPRIEVIDRQAQQRMMEIVQQELQKSAARGDNPKDIRDNPLFKKNLDALEGAAPNGAKIIEFPRSGYSGVGQMVVESDEFREYVSRSCKGASREIKIAMSRAPGVNGGADTQTVMSTDYQQRVVPLPFRRTYVRDLMNVVPTDSAAITYLQETGFTNGAAAVARTSSDPATAVAAPQSDYTSRLQTAVVRDIEHQIPIPRNMMDDAPMVVGRIEANMMDGLFTKEGAYILTGSGVAPIMEGILTNADIQTHAWSAGDLGDNRADAVLRAIVIAEIALYAVDGIVLSLRGAELIKKMKDTAGNYLIPEVHRSDVALSLWGRMVAEHTQLADNKCIVGGWKSAATLYSRLEASIQFLMETNDDAVKGLIRAYGRMRSVAAWERPENFVAVTFDNAPA